MIRILMVVKNSFKYNLEISAAIRLIIRLMTAKHGASENFKNDKKQCEMIKR